MGMTPGANTGSRRILGFSGAQKHCNRMRTAEGEQGQQRDRALNLLVELHHANEQGSVIASSARSVVQLLPRGYPPSDRN